MTSLLTGIQAVNIGGLVLLLVACCYLYFRLPNMRELLVPPGIWAAYGVVFYTLIFTDQLTGEAQLLWGAIHRMLVIYMLLGGLVAMWAILTAPEPIVSDEGDNDD